MFSAEFFLSEKKFPKTLDILVPQRELPELTGYDIHTNHVKLYGRVGIDNAALVSIFWAWSPSRKGRLSPLLDLSIDVDSC